MSPLARHAMGSGLALDGERANATDKAILGRRIPMVTNGPANALVTQATQLISARVNQPRQWVVTMMQAVTVAAGVQPWANTIDQQTSYPGAGLFLAPNFPNNIAALRVALRWGAGGTAFETQFDYPIAGGVFGITADVVDLNVSLSATYASANLVPVVGAFMVPGRAADPTPLRWMELREDPQTAGGSVFFGVKPYARRFRVSAPDQTVTYVVEWFNTAGNTLWKERRSQPAGVVGDTWDFDIPAAATLVSITNGDGSNRLMSYAWEIGLV